MTKRKTTFITNDIERSIANANSSLELMFCLAPTLANLLKGENKITDTQDSELLRITSLARERLAIIKQNRAA